MSGAGVQQTGCAPRMNDSPAAGSARGHAGLLVDRVAAEQIVRPVTRQHDLDLLACPRATNHSGTAATRALGHDVSVHLRCATGG